MYFFFCLDKTYVRRENYEGVVIEARLAELIRDVSYCLVQRRNHTCSKLKSYHHCQREKNSPIQKPANAPKQRETTKQFSTRKLSPPLWLDIGIQVFVFLRNLNWEDKGLTWNVSKFIWLLLFPPENSHYLLSVIVHRHWS